MFYTPPPRDPKAPPVRINLLSDTQTRPTAGMRDAMSRAEVGDEQIGDDPTVNLLCERVADLLGKEAAVFMPSGTMCNVAATLVHCRPGDEILAHETAHIIAREGGAHAALGGFQIMPLKGDDGQFSPATLRAALHPRTRYQPPQTLVSVEQTANIGGGTIWKKAALDEVVAIARSAGLATHMDGARLLTATVATGISARDMATAPSSTRSGAGSSGSAARCASPGFALRPAYTRSIIMSIVWPRTTPMRGRWRADCRRLQASTCRSPRPILSSSNLTAQAFQATRWSRRCAGVACCSR
jgi:hypothetical protein